VSSTKKKIIEDEKSVEEEENLSEKVEVRI